jgi:hypothetical protein
MKSKRTAVLLGIDIEDLANLPATGEKEES